MCRRLRHPRTVRVGLRLIGAFFLVGAALVAVEEVHLYAAGRSAGAVVLRESGYTGHYRYLVRFAGPGGADRTGWLAEDGEELRVGQRVEVRYDPGHPTDIEVRRGLLGTVVWKPAVVAVLALVFLVVLPYTVEDDRPVS